MNRAVLITGATGFVGKQLVEMLCTSLPCFLLIRSESMEKAKKIFSEHKNVHFIEGDICQIDLFSFEKDVKRLNRYELTVIHCAALYQFDATLLDNYRLNILGTQNILRAMNDLKHVNHYIHLSSIAVAGNFSGRIFYEKNLIEGQMFSSYYAKTKFDSECIVQSTPLKCFKSIVRPGVIIGDSRSGDFEKIDGPYYIIRALHRISKSPLSLILNKVGILPMPFDLDARLPLISIDSVVRFIGELALYPVDKNRTYHLTDGTSGESVKQFINHVCQKLNLNVQIKPLSGQWIWKKIAPFMAIPAESISYMYQSLIFDTTHCKEDYSQVEVAKFEDIRDVIINSAIMRFEREEERKHD